MNFNNIIVRKFWGQEYCLFENENVSIWHLFIKENQSTSLHSHPKKKTGLIVLAGGAILSFLKDTYKLYPLDKTILRAGVFHKTTAKVGDVELLEIETPPDKLDLVRLEDNYGREGTAYEGPENYISTKIDRISLGETRFLGKCKLESGISNLEDISFIQENEIFIILKGQIHRRGIVVAAPGDLFYKDTLELMLSKFSVDGPIEYIVVKNA